MSSTETTFAHTLPTGETIDFVVTRRPDLDAEAGCHDRGGARVDVDTYGVTVRYEAGIDLSAHRVDAAYPTAAIAAWLGEVIGAPVRFVDCLSSEPDDGEIVEVWQYRAA